MYGLGYNGTTGALQLYLLSLEAGVATAVGSTGTFVDGGSNPVRIGEDGLTKIGMDFNPTNDRIRVVTTNGQNFRINPNTGAFIDGDGGTGGVNMDTAINGATSSVGEAAYTNNSLSTLFTSITTLYTVDPITDSIYIQTPQNNGTQTSAIPLKLGGNLLDIIEARGFDIPSGVNAASSNTAVASGTAYGVLELASNSQQRFCSIDLTNGNLLGASLLSGDSGSILGLAVQSATARSMVALSDNNELFRFLADSPSTSSMVTLSGITSGENVVGIDLSPTTGQLYGLGIHATNNNGTLYLIDPITGASTVVGIAGGIGLVSGGGSPIDFPALSSGYGVDINPTDNRMRVVTGTGLHFAVNLSTGFAVDGSGSDAGTNPYPSLNGDSNRGDAAAFTDSYAGATATTLYTLDASSNSLYVVNPLNDGVLTLVDVVRQSGNAVDFDVVAALKIPGTVKVPSSGSEVSTGSALAALRIAGVTSLFSIDLASATASNLGAIDSGATPIIGLAVGEIEAN